jgi:neutral ceramidase
MRVGHAAVPLEVPVGTPLGGYAGRSGPSTGTLDTLSVAAVSIESGGTRFVWVVADLPYVHEDLAAQAAATMPDAVVWLSASHTHAGPETSCLPTSATTPAPWRAAVASAAARAMAEAVSAERDALLELRRTRLTGVGGQRSGARPRRTVPVDILSFTDPSGTLLGAVVVLPVHPTVLGADNLCVSADLTGATRRALAGVGGWAMVATGAAGDVSTRAHRLAQTPEECARLGGVVGETVARSLRRPARAVVPPHASIGERRLRVPLEAKPPPGSPRLILDLESRLARADGAVAQRTAWTALQAARLAAESPAPAVDPACVAAAVRIGPVSLVALGAEPYLALGERLDDALGHPTVLIGYTNGYLGYLPVRDAYRRADYEVLRSPVVAGSAEIVLDQAAALALANRKDRP